MTAMTLHATRDPHDTVKVHMTYGPVTAAVTEDPGHARSFHGQLGRVLDQIEEKEPGQRAYERYREHVGGTGLATGAPLPTWEDNEQKYRDAWAHAAG